MTNNDILRRVRYLFDFSDSKMVALFKLADDDVTTTDIIGWLEKEGETLFVEMTDKKLAIFLNGLIIEKRGKREGPQPKPEESLTNNVILRKFKIALDLKSEDMLELFESVDRKISKHELSAFFRKPGNKSYQLCMNQYLRAFLNALQLKHRKY